MCEDVLELTKFYRPRILFQRHEFLNCQQPQTTQAVNQIIATHSRKCHAPEAPQAAQKAHTSSAIHNALEGGKREGLLHYFPKATHKQHEDHLIK